MRLTRALFFSSSLRWFFFAMPSYATLCSMQILCIPQQKHLVFIYISPSFFRSRQQPNDASNVIFVTISFIQDVFEIEILFRLERLSLCSFVAFWRFFIAGLQLPYGGAHKGSNVILRCTTLQPVHMRIMATIKQRTAAQIGRMPNTRNVQLALLKVRYCSLFIFVFNLCSRSLFFKSESTALHTKPQHFHDFGFVCLVMNHKRSIHCVKFSVKCVKFTYVRLDCEHNSIKYFVWKLLINGWEKFHRINELKCFHSNSESSEYRIECWFDPLETIWPKMVRATFTQDGFCVYINFPILLFPLSFRQCFIR